MLITIILQLLVHIDTCVLFIVQNAIFFFISINSSPFLYIYFPLHLKIHIDMHCIIFLQLFCNSYSLHLRTIKVNFCLVICSFFPLEVKKRTNKTCDICSTVLQLNHLLTTFPPLFFIYIYFPL